MRIGFLDIFESEDLKDTIYGGILVTDLRGIPTEVRWATMKVKQRDRLIFGRSLAYLTAERMSDHLVFRLKKEPNLLFVQKQEFLSFRSCVKIPVYLVSTVSGAENIANRSKYSVTTQDKHPDDLSKTREVAKLLDGLDPDEVFGRISLFLTECIK